MAYINKAPFVDRILEMTEVLSVLVPYSSKTNEHAHANKTVADAAGRNQKEEPGRALFAEKNR